MVNNMEEEDAFWILAAIVENFCAGMYSRAMLSIQVCSTHHDETPLDRQLCIRGIDRRKTT